MCWFITVGIRKDAAAALENLEHERRGLGVRPSKNPHVAALFPATDARFEITLGHCSCELWLGPREQDAAEREKRRDQYLKNGWSEARIARALNAAAEARTASVRANRTSGPRADFRHAIAKQVEAVGSVRLLAHFYGGSQDQELVVCRERRQISIEEFLAGELPEDVVLEVVPRAG